MCPKTFRVHTVYLRLLFHLLGLKLNDNSDSGALDMVMMTRPAVMGIHSHHSAS